MGAERGVLLAEASSCLGRDEGHRVGRRRYWISPFLHSAAGFGDDRGAEEVLVFVEKVGVFGKYVRFLAAKETEEARKLAKVPGNLREEKEREENTPEEIEESLQFMGSFIKKDEAETKAEDKETLQKEAEKVIELPQEPTESENDGKVDLENRY